MGGASLDGLPGWVTLLRAPNPGPMTLDGTNTWVLRAPGEELGFVIDPGPLDEGHLRRVAEHGPFRAIMITHGHHDHVEGAPRLSEMLGGTPIETAPFDSDGLTIRILDTPGHTADSVCFLVESGNVRAMLTGDTILGRGSTVVAAPDGDLGSYLDSLTVLTAYENVLMLPGHGPAQNDVAALARGYLDHRRERLAQVEDAMARGAETPEEVVDLVYPEIDPAVRFAAIFSAKAQLDYLHHKNRESGTRADGLDRL
ncbi:MBL fold metallo-hydrolase [Paractinoplanes rhizophilus]|jgi:glyoxylase-like metal-dependent hydrolase (beta-lactamase superfamily II)|uniref:MBL fold metallo-hydrolase n=1 Tax=Paractinoplanes rhizophilus TaxID=1416877 RepID=A0ABW2I023_9ACTN